MTTTSSLSPAPSRQIQSWQTHGIARRSEVTLLRESLDYGWQGLYASLVQESPWEAELPPATMSGIAFSVGAACRVTRSSGGPQESAVLRPRQFSVLPGGLASRWRIAGNPRILHLYLHEDVFAQVADDLRVERPSASALSHRLCVYDPVIANLADSAHALLCEGSTRSAYIVEHLAHALAGRLISHHGAGAAVADAPTVSALPAHRWRDLVDYIDANIGENLSLEALAQVAAVRPTQLWRAFRANSGISPHQYVLERRLALARAMLVEAAEPLAQIATTAGFSSQSHMASAFRKRFGHTPTAYRLSHGRQAPPLTPVRGAPG